MQPSLLDEMTHEMIMFYLWEINQAEVNTANGLLDAAIDPVVIPCLEDLLLKDCPEMLFGYPQQADVQIGLERLLNSGIHFNPFRTSFLSSCCFYYK